MVEKRISKRRTKELLVEEVVGRFLTHRARIKSVIPIVVDEDTVALIVAVTIIKTKAK